jgi:ketosteroid isomerase-like protein
MVPNSHRRDGAYDDLVDPIAGGLDTFAGRYTRFYGSNDPMTAESFDQFLATTRPDAASAYVTGDAAPVTSISTRVDPATFYGPSGGSVVGAEAVIETNAAGAAMFEPGGETRLEMLHSGHDGDLGYWVGFQHATVSMAEGGEPVRMKLRITELFRYEGDTWKLIHRHADQHVDADQC